MYCVLIAFLNINSCYFFLSDLGSRFRGLDYVGNESGLSPQKMCSNLDSRQKANVLFCLMNNSMLAFFSRNCTDENKSTIHRYPVSEKDRDRFTVK